VKASAAHLIRLRRPLLRLARRPPFAVPRLHHRESRPLPEPSGLFPRLPHLAWATSVPPLRPFPPRQTLRPRRPPTATAPSGSREVTLRGGKPHEGVLIYVNEHFSAYSPSPHRRLVRSSSNLSTTSTISQTQEFLTSIGSDLSGLAAQTSSMIGDFFGKPVSTYCGALRFERF